MENNYLNASDRILKDQLEAKLANGTISDSEVFRLVDLTAKDLTSDANLKAACADGASPGCIHELKLAQTAKDSYQGFAEYQTYYDLRDKYPDEMAKFGDLIGDYTHDLVKLIEQGYTKEQAQTKLAQDAAYAAKYQQALEDIPGWAKIAVTIQDTVGMVYGAKAAGVSLETLAAKTGTSTTPQVNIAKDFTKSPQAIWGRSADEIVKDFQAAGYEVNVRQSTRGSGQAVIIEVKGHPEISQIQYHPGGGRHEGSYYKVSTTTQGTMKVVDPSSYKPTPGEKATIISKPKE